MYKILFSLSVCLIVMGTAVYCFADISGQDLYLTGKEIVASTVDDEKVFIVEDTATINIGDNQLSASKAVVWVKQLTNNNMGIVNRDYRIKAYLEGDVSIKGGRKSRMTNINHQLVERGNSLFVTFIVSGQVFVSGDNLNDADISGMDIYRKVASLYQGDKLVVNITKKAQVPGIVPPPFSTDRPQVEQQPQVEKDTLLSKIVPKQITRQEKAKDEQPDEPQYKYPVNIAALWKPAPRVERSVTSDGVNIITVQGRFYVWQRINDAGDIVEFQASNAVIFYSGKDVKVGQQETGRADLLAGGDFDSIYIEGDIVMTEGEKTIKADRLFYDFNKKQALAENAEMSRFNADRSIPIYLRAERLVRLNEQVFAGENIVMTSDEFYLPQISAQASSIVITDTKSLDSRQTDNDYQAEMKDVSIKYYDTSILKLNTLKSGLERPELPIKKVRVGSDTSFGSFVETDWYLSRVLGYKEPADTESTLSLDYYSKRGFGAGAGFNYETEDYFGAIDSYIIKDHGEDRLGDADWRKNLEPESDVRGRYRMVHREYLPQDWQLTYELSYLSDRNFLESFYRSEFYTGKEQETLIHLKRSTDNWAVSWLAKVRINDFENYLEELPSFEYHRTGQSFWDDTLTFYNDTQISRMRQRYDNDISTTASDDFFAYAYTRNEIDMPFTWGKTKYVPYVAASYIFDDGDGFNTDLDSTTTDPEKDLLLGEIGLRASTLFWDTDQFKRSELWGINGVRHYIRPHLEVALYESSDSTVEMRNMLNLGLAQTWQTRRGSIDDLKTIDWMKLDMNTTFVSDSSHDPENTEPSSFIFNNPAIPFFNRRYTADYGLERNTFEADYFWQVSDTFATMSYLNADIQSGVIQQFNVGVSKFCWPSVSYYLGSRYLRRLEVTGPDGYNEKGSNAFNAAVTYKISPRYTVTFAQEYNFDYGKNVDNELTLIRKYNRLYYGLSYKADESLGSNSIVFSVWPEGVKELAVGSRTYIGLADTTSY